MSKSFKELLAEARLPRRIVSICMRGDLTVEAQRLEDELEAVQMSPVGPARLSDGGRDEELAQQLEALRVKMRDEAVAFELEAQPAHAWRALKAKHPVIDEPKPIDNVVGADATGFFNEAVRAAIVDPKIDDEDWEHLTTVLSEGEWSKLVEAVYALNEQPVSIPLSLRAFEVLQTHSDASELPEMLDGLPES